jgi:hypothetical protein
LCDNVVLDADQVLLLQYVQRVIGTAGAAAAAAAAAASSCCNGNRTLA